MNTFGATSPGPRPVAEMPANRTGGDAAEDRDEGGNPFGAVLGALNGAAVEAAPVSQPSSQPARPGRRREADSAEVAPVSDPLGLLAAVAAPMPAALTPAATEPTGQTGPIAFETLVALAVPERPAGPRMEPDAEPAPESSLPGETAIPALGALPETIPAPDPSVPVDATIPAIQSSAIVALVQALAPAQVLASVKASPLVSGAVPPSVQPTTSPAQARPRVTVLRQETHFAPVMPRSLGTLAAAPAASATAPATVAAALLGQGPAATPVSLATLALVPPLLPGDGPSPVPMAPVPVAVIAPQNSQPAPVAAPVPGTAVSPPAAVRPALSPGVAAAPAFTQGEPRPVQAAAASPGERPALAAVGPDDARAVAAPVVVVPSAGGDSLPFVASASVAPASVPAIEAPAAPVVAWRAAAPSASMVPATHPSPAVAATQPAVTIPAPVTAPTTPVVASAPGRNPARSALPASSAPASEPAIDAPADAVDAPTAAPSGTATPAMPAANPTRVASVPQPAMAQPTTETVPASPPPLVPDATVPVRSEPTPAPQGAPLTETTVAPRHTALGMAESDEAGIAGRDVAAEVDPGGVVPAPQPTAPPSASGLVSGAPSSAPVRQIAEAVAAEAARAGSAQPGALPGQPGSEGPLRVLTLQLRPMDLGTVVVRMRLRGSQLEMSLHANHAETAELLRKDGALLSALLRDAGYHSDAVTIGTAPAEPASGSASASGQGVPSESGGQNPGREMSDQPARRQPGTGADRINDARERTNDANPAGPDRSGVYL